MLSDKEKALAWTKLRTLINHVTEEESELSFEERRYLRDACVKQRPVVEITNRGGFARFVRTYEANKAAYTAVQIFRARGDSKTDAYEKAAKHFGVSISSIRTGVQGRKKLLAGKPFENEATLNRYKNRDLPHSSILENPDKDK